MIIEPESPSQPRNISPKKSLIKNTGFLACTIFLIIGAFICILSSIPLIISSVYQDKIVVGLEEDLKVAGAGFLVFGLLVTLTSIIGMIYSAYSRSKETENNLYENDGYEEYPNSIGFTNPVFGNSNEYLYSKNICLKDIPL